MVWTTNYDVMYCCIATNYYNAKKNSEFMWVIYLLAKSVLHVAASSENVIPGPVLLEKIDQTRPTFVSNISIRKSNGKWKQTFHSCVVNSSQLLSAGRLAICDMRRHARVRKQMRMRTYPDLNYPGPLIHKRARPLTSTLHGTSLRVLRGC